MADGSRSDAQIAAYRQELERVQRELPFTKAKMELQAKSFPKVPLDSCIRDLEHVLRGVAAVLGNDDDGGAGYGTF